MTDILGPGYCEELGGREGEKGYNMGDDILIHEADEADCGGDCGCGLRSVKMKEPSSSGEGDNPANKVW